MTVPDEKVNRPNLAGAFSGKAQPIDRSAGLAGLLPPKPTTEAAVVPAQQPKAEDAEPAKVASKKTAPRETSTKPARAQAVSGGVVSNVAVYLESSLLAATKAALREKDTTYDALVVEAFEAIDDTQLVALFLDDGTATTSAMPVRTRRRRGEPGIQVQLRLDDAQKAWLEDKVAAVRAPSRSALVAGVLKLHLAGS